MTVQQVEDVIRLIELQAFIAARGDNQPVARSIHSEVAEIENRLRNSAREEHGE